MSDLAKRAVACAGWRWMPGMLAVDTGLRLDEMTIDWEGCVPDLTDPATLGCLLALVREAWGEECWVTPGEPDEWFVWSISSYEKGCSIGRGTEEEALVAALEAAEGREVKDE